MNSLALYLHIPFCGQRCHYCDFNTFSGQDRRQADYVAALSNEIRLWGRTIDQSTLAQAPTKTIFFGGGTPSRLSPEEIGTLLDACRKSFRVQPDAEITMEANPNDGTVERLSGYRAAGVNRLSFGVQVMDDALLPILGRDHAVADVYSSIDSARTVGFDNLNVDLIYGLPGQTLEGWRLTLQEALKLDVEHISTYGLTIEPNTRFGHDAAAGRISAVDPDLAADMVETADALVPESGYERYEIANFSKPGRECRHNLTYWRNEPFLGLGAGAHSSTVVSRFGDVRALGSFIRNATRWHGPSFTDLIPTKDGLIEWVDPLSEATMRGETMMLGLRLREGVNRQDYAARRGIDPVELWKHECDELTGWGLLDISNDTVRLTDRGRMMGDDVFVRFVQPLNE